MVLNRKMNCRSGRLRIPAILVAAVLALSLAETVRALDVPRLSGRVVDEAGIISSSVEGTLDDYFQRIEDATGAQIAILTVASLDGEVLERYSIKVLDEWQLGQADQDNGVLLLVAAEEKQIRIEVGYGLEGRLTDATSGVIIREYLQPYFRNGDFDGGFIAASQAIGSVVADGAEIASPATSSGSRPPASTASSSRGIPINLAFFIIVFVLGSMGRFGRRRGSGLWSLLFWSSIVRGGSSRYSRGGFGGGGFGGFSGGGGGFGGGGASGGW